MPASIFDELIFQAGPLGELPPASPASLQVQIPVGSEGQTYQQPVPLFARRPPMPASDINWPAYCSLLKSLGIPLQVPLSAFEHLSLASVPPRFARRSYDEGFHLDELETADAIEIRCMADSATQAWARMPLDASAWHELKLLIETLREVTGGATPIGIGMLAGDVYADVSNALAARVDFIVLEAPGAAGGLEPVQSNHLAWSVVAARLAASQSSAAAFPIFVDAPLERVDHLIKLLALGASAVSIDALARLALSSVMEQAVVVPKGMLSSLGSLPLPSQATANVEPLARTLNDFLERLRNQIFQQQIDRLSLLHRDHLRALTELAARLCAVGQLGH